METNNSPAVKKKGIIKRMLLLVKKHKFISFLILAAVIGGYYYFRPSSTQAETRYVLSAVSKDSVINTVSGSGSVEAANQIDVKPEVSADIKEIDVKAGEDVKEGDVIAVLDSVDLEKALKNARNSLASAQASLASKLAGATEEEIKLSENSVKTAKMSYEQAQQDLEDAKYDNSVNLDKAKQNLDDAQRDYDNAVASNGISSDSQDQSLDSTYKNAQSSVNSAYLSLKSALVTADEILGLGEYGETTRTNNYLIGAKDPQSLTYAKDQFYSNKDAFDAFEKEYLAAVQPWTKDQVEYFLDKAYSLASGMKTMAGNLYNVALGTVSSGSLTESQISSMQQSASSQQSAMMSLAGNLQSSQQSIASAKLNASSSDLSSSNSLAKAESSLASAKQNYEQAQRDTDKNLNNAQQSLESKQISYENAQVQYEEKIAPPREVDLTSMRLQVSSAQEDYQEALDNLNSATVKSPIDGKIAKVYQSVGDSASPSNIIASIITDKSLAVVSLNEVDVAKVKIGQKAVLAFSAVDGLTITGEVVSIDSIGESTQGVVSYEAKISFDTQDDRIKPQMSVDAEIVVDESVDTLVVPNSALETDANGEYYVKTLDTTGIEDATSTQGIAYDKSPSYAYVNIGLEDDTNTEILQGLEEGDLVVTKTVTGTASAKTSSSSGTSALSGLSGRSGGSFMMMGGGAPR